MRTTVRLDEALLARAKAYAASRNRTLTSVLEDALRQLLDRQEAASAPHHIDLVVYGEGGLIVEVDLDHNSAWREMEDEAAAERYAAS